MNREARNAVTPIVAGLVSSLVAAAAGAQAVRGTIVESGTRTAVAGAIVALVDGSGRVVGATMASDDGVYLLVAPAPGSYRLRVERVGYTSSTSSPVSIRDRETTDYVFAITSQPVTLRAVKVVADQRCIVRPQEGLEVAQLWEEARKALYATRIAQAQRRFALRLRGEERELDPATLAVRHSERWEKEEETETPFVAIDSLELARSGYARTESDGSSSYFAPDAQVLLSDLFLDSHCFRSEPGVGRRAGMVGLAFEPIPTRRVPEIRGVLWLDERSARLRLIEYRYVHLDVEVASDQVGGEVEFEQLPSGRWMVNRWHIRMPVVAVSYVTTDLRTRVPERRSVLKAIKQIGWEVVQVYPLSSHSSGVASLSGLAYDSLRSAPLAGAKVFLSGTSYAATADAQGRYRIDSVPPGLYSVSLIEPGGDSLLRESPVRSVSLSAGHESHIDLAYRSFAAEVHALCPATVLPDSSAVVLGVVHGRVPAQIAPDARVTATWQQVAKTAAGVLTATEMVAESATDAHGRYAICGLPVWRRLQLQASRGNTRSEPAYQRTEPLAAYRIDFALPLPPASRFPSP